MTIQARRFRVTGLVQGVGFRPTVYRIAVELGLVGDVFNDPLGVEVHLEGPASQLDEFKSQLLKQKPPLARIDTIVASDVPVKGYTAFEIAKTQANGPVKTSITADACTCQACFDDILNPQNRRYRYAFTNCTHCGPRFTITRALPYDRPQTSMATFPMCEACQKEYEDPLDRRFHAQPNACAVCGPQLKLTDAAGRAVEGDVIDLVAQRLRAGDIVAIKGIGGFHLVCDATQAAAVQRLRQRKHRDEKPLAVMVSSVAAAKRYATLTPAAIELLTSAAHPIVLAPKTTVELEGIAPGLNEIGVMLPYTPLHALIFHSLLGHPTDVDPLQVDNPWALVMTSANPGGEPLVIDNDEAYARLGHIADWICTHNRDILIRCDDSVVRVVDEAPIWVRRARGLTPQAIATVPLTPEVNVLALGSYLKNTASLSRDHEIFLSQHIGDLENVASCQALPQAAQHLQSILEVTPDAYASDLHPDFYSTRLAQELAQTHQKPWLGIQHHAAHIGAVMSEYQRTQTTFGLALDGVGLGADGDIWGGECLKVGPTGFTRLGRLRPLPIAGGDKAAQEPWRMGAAILEAIGQSEAIATTFSHCAGAPWMAQLLKSPHTPKSSALGRVFDGVSALLGLCDYQRDEATAAMRLEACAAACQQPIALPEAPLATVTRTDRGLFELDLTPLFKRLWAYQQAGVERASVAHFFHQALSQALLHWVHVIVAAQPQPVTHFALSGGCMLNRVLAHALPEGLRAQGITPLMSHQVPPGDGGISLGQCWLAKLALQAGVTHYRYENDEATCHA